MKSSRNKLLGVLLLLVFVIPLGMAVRKAYRDLRQPELNSALIVAVRKNDTTQVVSLLAQGADANVVSWYGSSALHLAAAKHDPAFVQLLLARGALVSAKDRDGKSPLDWAV